MGNIGFRSKQPFPSSRCACYQQTGGSRTDIRLTLSKLGHPHPQNPIHIDNTTAAVIVNNTIKRQRSRAMEMRYFWLLDQEKNKYFKFYYQPGQENLVDYPSKAHTGTINTHVRPYYLHMDSSPILLTRADIPSARRGCTEII